MVRFTNRKAHSFLGKSRAPVLKKKGKSLKLCVIHVVWVHPSVVECGIPPVSIRDRIVFVEAGPNIVHIVRICPEYIPKLDPPGRLTITVFDWAPGRSIVTV